jgi:hypothetical protein
MDDPMKSTVVLLLSSCLSALTPSAAQAQAPQTISSPSSPLPIIIRASWKATPGQAVGIYGWNFGTSAGTQVAIQPLSSGALDPSSAAIKLPLQDVQNNLIEGILPTDLAGDVYALWVNNAKGWSSPTFINRAEVFWASEGEVYPGQGLRFFGRNFRNPATGSFEGSQVKLTTLDGKTSIPAAITLATDYTVDVVVPAQIQPGSSYTAQITNGAGGANGWTQMEDQASFTAVPENSSIQVLNTMFGLNAAWVRDIPVSQMFNVADYGAVGDGVTVDTKGLQATLDAAGRAGGGIVNLSAGTYLSSTLRIPQRTVLLGAGMNTTKLVYDNLAPSTFSNFLVESGPEIGIARLSVVNTSTRPVTLNNNHSGYVNLLYFGNNRHQAAQPGIFMESVTLNNADGNGLYHGYSPADVIIEHSIFKTSHTPITVFSPNSHVRIRDNTLTNTVRNLLYQDSDTPNSTQVAPSPVFTWVEGNVFKGSGCENNLNQVGCSGISGSNFGEHRIMDGTASFQYIANNASQGEFGGPGVNDGEGLNFQAEHRFAYSRIATATEVTMTDPTQTFQPDQLIGTKIAIIGGTGIGQLRTITGNTASRVSIDKPWQVILDASSVYTIDAFVNYHNIIVGNQLQATQSAAAVEVYTKSYDNIVANNSTSNSMGIMINANQVPGQRRADFAYFNYVADNTLIGASNPRGNVGNSSLIGILDTRYHGDTLHATVVYGDEYRLNVLKSIGIDNGALCTGNGYNCRTFTPYNGLIISAYGAPVSYPFAQGVLVENNTVTNAIAGIHLFNTAFDTLLKGNNFVGNGTPIDDRGSIRTTLQNRR